jgi:hypothetical protein
LQRRDAQYVSVGVAVLALHAAGVCWLLLSKMRAVVAPEAAQSLEIFWIPAVRRPRPSSAEAHQQTPRESTPSIRSEPSRRPPQQNPAPPQNDAITPPIDWQAELAREAQAAASARSEPRLKDFGFPQRAPSAARAPEFAWDRNHTHRIEAGSGALVVHINDNCTFVMTPLPFVFCSPGKRPANGDLFGNMKDSPAGAAGSAQ